MTANSRTLPSMTKLNIKMEPNGNLTAGGQGFNLPPTPPSSLPSDDSEGNQSPEHSSPMSPPINNVSSSSSSNSSSSGNVTTAATTRRSQQLQQQGRTMFSGTGGSSSNSSSSNSNNSSSSRQPIHTPLISSQPVIIRLITLYINYLLLTTNAFYYECIAKLIEEHGCNIHTLYGVTRDN